MKTKRTKFYILLTVLAFLSSACSSSKVPERVVTQAPPPPEHEIQKAVEVKPEEEKPLQDVPSSPPEEKESMNNETFMEKEDPAALLEEALFTYQDAQAAWEKGNFDNALQALDDAYSLILKAELPSDSPLSQGKNDLRLLIAQRIQQIYASRLVTVGDNHKTIPVVENEHVQKEIRSFQTTEKRYFEEAYERSGLYREIILEELRKAGLPEELSWLPMIESWFKVKALSRARALGLWQFISSTGYRFGLKRDRWIDERMDPVKSTQAAIRYLTELHSFFGDWTTALAAYNCGEIRIQNVIRTQQVDYLDDFWDLFMRLPYETARFVPRFMGTLLIIQNPEKYGFNLPSAYPPLRFETITVKHPFKLSALAAALGIEAAELATLNPELRYESTPDYEYSFRVPLGYGDRALTAVNSLSKWIPPEISFAWHTVRRGETLSTIARRYGTSVSAIARLNRLSSVHYIRPGQKLKIPTSSRRGG